MNWKIIAVFLLGIVFVACQPTSNTNTNSTAATNSGTTSTSKTAPTDLKELAQRLVTQSAGVKEGEIVLISGGVRDMELLENIVTEVQKVGGEPLLSINSDRMAKNSFTEVPEKFDTQEQKLGMILAKSLNVTIGVNSNEIEGLLADVSPARLAARGKAGEPAGAEFRRNKVRTVNVGNGLYPTEWLAKRFETPLADFTKQFWEGVNIDYADLQTTGEKAKTALVGKEVEITHPNGTNLKMNIEGRPVYISDGIISDDDVKNGSIDVFLPAGEAAVVPVANSGDGKFVIDKDFFQGKEITNVTLTFEGGKLVSLTGEGPGFAAYKASYDAGGEGKELLGFFDIGINANYKLPAGNKLGNWISAGVVTVGTGNNTFANGSNNVSAGISGHLTGATIKIDGKTIVDNGELKL